MADSDGEYIQDISDDDIGAHQVTSGPGRGTRSSGRQRNRGTNQSAQQTWEVRRTWENVVEGADGTISSTVEGLLEAGKRKRSVIRSEHSKVPAVGGGEERKLRKADGRRDAAGSYAIRRPCNEASSGT